MGLSQIRNYPESSFWISFLFKNPVSLNSNLQLNTYILNFISIFLQKLNFLHRIFGFNMSGTLNPQKITKYKPLKSAPSSLVIHENTSPTKKSLSTRCITSIQSINSGNKTLNTIPVEKDLSDLHGMILEYFELQGLKNAYNAFSKDCLSYGLLVPENLGKPKFPAITKFTPQDACLLLKYFDSMDGGNAFQLWEKYCEELDESITTVEGHDITEMTLFLRIYAGSLPFQMETEDIKVREKAVIELREFHEQNIEKFTKHPICLPFFAFPFVVDPREHDAFKMIFSSEWKDELRQKIKQVLDSVTTTTCSDTSRLFNLYCQSLHSNVEIRIGKENEALESAKTQITNLKENGAKLKDALIICENQYYKLLRFTQNLVGAVQRGVKGEPQDLNLLEKQITETLPEIIRLGEKCQMPFIENGSGEYIGAGFVKINQTVPCSASYFSSCESGECSDAELIIDPLIRLSSPRDDVSKEKFCALTGFVPGKWLDQNGDERISVASAPSALALSENFPKPPRTYCIPPEKSLLLSGLKMKQSNQILEELKPDIKGFQPTIRKINNGLKPILE